MKYFEIAENMHFFDFVFYECENKTMYIYCPNCNQEHEVEITKQHNVKWLKANYQPCDCFKFRGIQPIYKHSRHDYENLKRVLTVGEFQKRQNGDVALNVYWHIAEFDVGNYYTWGYCLRRYPVYSLKKIIEIVYTVNQTVSIVTSLDTAVTPNVEKEREWHKTSKWYNSFRFEIIYESINELKGTMLEQFIPDINVLYNFVSDKTNCYCSLNEIFGAWLQLMYTKNSVKKLWKAGYKYLVLNKTLELLLHNKELNKGYVIGATKSGFIINYQGETLDKILRIQPQKLDLLADREDITVELLYGAQKITRYPNVQMNKQNINIAQTYRFDDLAQLFERLNIPISKLFKFLRHEIRKVNRSEYSVVSDYYDYVEMLQKLNTPLTNDVLLPSNFTSSHDNTVAKYNEFKNICKSKDFVLSISKYKNFSFSDGHFKIDLISSIKQLLKEANKFHNCSAGYIDRIIQGSSVLFLIKEIEHPRKNVYMLEYNPEQKRIIQNRGIRNIDAPEDVKEFAANWLMQSNIIRA